MSLPSTKLKPPFTYYGGKQQMLPHILPLIPIHELYAEPFAGGAALFWAKEPSPMEVLNDMNGEIANFYEVLKTQGEKLNRLIQRTLHSRRDHNFARCILSFPEEFDKVRRAWALWVMTNQSLYGQISDTWSLDKPNGNRPTARTGKALENKRLRFDSRTPEGLLVYAERLQHVQIDCTDALTIIRTRDTPMSFFYLDPPYYNSDCGHYSGYTQGQFEDLLRMLGGLNGKFLLSCYDSDIIRRYVDEQGWTMSTFDMALTAGTASGRRQKRKTECLIRNY